MAPSPKLQFQIAMQNGDVDGVKKYFPQVYPDGITVGDKPAVRGSRIAMPDSPLFEAITDFERITEDSPKQEIEDRKEILRYMLGQEGAAEALSADYSPLADTVIDYAVDEKKNTPALGSALQVIREEDARRKEGEKLLDPEQREKVESALRGSQDQARVQPQSFLSEADHERIAEADTAQDPSRQAEQAQSQTAMPRGRSSGGGRSA